MRTRLGILIASSWASSLIALFYRLGAFGFFLLEALDSSFFYLPLANELLMIAFVRSGRTGPVWVLYVLMAALGSVAGVLLLDLLMRKAGEKGLEKFVKPKRLRWLKSRLEKNAGWLVFISSTMPPPFPFRVVIISAAALQSPRRKMLFAVFFGRLVRFGVEAALVLYFGRRLLGYLKSDLLEYVVYAMVAVATVGSIFTIGKLVNSRREAPSASPSRATD